MVEAAQLLQRARQTDSVIYTTGNGGSGSIASHFAGDLLKNSANASGKICKAVCLNDNFTAYSAFVNDNGQVSALTSLLKALYGKDYFPDPDDVVVIISSSGESENLLHLASYCREEDTPCIGIIGASSTSLAKLCTVAIELDAPEYRLNEPLFSGICHVLVHMMRDGKEHSTVTASR